MNDGLVLPPVDVAFRAIARTVVPEAADLSPEAWDELEAIVEEALSHRPPALRRQLAILIRALDTLPLFRYGRRLRALPPDRRQRFLEGIQSSRIYKLRQGFWGLRTLVYMGYYARAEGAAAIGYGARLRGWLEHPDAPESAWARASAGATDGRSSDAGEGSAPGRGDGAGGGHPATDGHVPGGAS